MIIDGKIYKNLFLDLVLNNVNINNPADKRPKNNNVIIVLSVKTLTTLVWKDAARSALLISSFFIFALLTKFNTADFIPENEKL